MQAAYISMHASHRAYDEGSATLHRLPSGPAQAHRKLQENNNVIEPSPEMLKGNPENAAGELKKAEVSVLDLTHAGTRGTSSTSGGKGEISLELKASFPP